MWTNFDSKCLQEIVHPSIKANDIHQSITKIALEYKMLSNSDRPNFMGWIHWDLITMGCNLITMP